MSRSLAELLEHQRTILAELRGTSAATPEPEPPDEPLPEATRVSYAQVSLVVEVDATYGPHLMVRRQRLAGNPPVYADMGEAPLRCFPAPHATVDKYVIGQFVRIVVVDGQSVAEPLN